MNLDRVTTRDVLAVLVVGAAILFNGISMLSGRDLDAATMSLASAIVGYYFKSEVVAREEEPVPAPFTGEDEQPE